MDSTAEKTQQTVDLDAAGVLWVTVSELTLTQNKHNMLPLSQVSIWIDDWNTLLNPDRFSVLNDVLNRQNPLDSPLTLWTRRQIPGTHEEKKDTLKTNT